MSSVRLVYKDKENPKHKPWTSGDGPPRWFPDSDSVCPEDIGTDEAQAMLDESIPGSDDVHRDARARYSLDDQGRFFKGYPEEHSEDLECWHGYLVRDELVPRQIPARVLREFVKRGRLTKARYRKLLGSAR